MQSRYLELLQTKPMTLIMSLPSNDPELARIAWEEGADVVKVHINVVHHASGTHYGTFDEERPVLERIIGEAKGPCGIVAGGDLAPVRRDYRACAQAGFEFVSLYLHHTPLEVLAFDGLVKMIALDYTWSPSAAASLKGIGANVLEASVMHPDSYGEPLSGRELLAYREICGLSELPVVVPTQRAILPEECVQLAEAGVAGIMIGAVVTGKSAQTLGPAVAAFRKALDSRRAVPAPRAVP